MRQRYAPFPRLIVNLDYERARDAARTARQPGARGRRRGRALSSHFRCAITPRESLDAGNLLIDQRNVAIVGRGGGAGRVRGPGRTQGPGLKGFEGCEAQEGRGSPKDG